VPDSIYCFDRAYIDFKWLYSLTSKKSWFVTRAKENLRFKVIGQHPVNDKKGLLFDREIVLTGFYQSKAYPSSLRLVGYRDKETNKEYTFLTNNFHLSAYSITQIYKTRWEIEIFFKWIKQNLKIKSFLGTSKNAVLTQIWIAMIYFLLLAYIKYQTKYKASLFYLHKVIKEALMMRHHLIDLLNLTWEKLRKMPPGVNPQLSLFGL
jgi:IS4 transposase